MSPYNNDPTGSFATNNLSSSLDINTDDIEDVTVLQGPASAALFGPDGANGAIVINTKKAKRGYSHYYWSDYKLSSAEDEDYVQEMQNAPRSELWDTFLELEKEHTADIGFYFEMADFFHGKSWNDRAQEMMYNAVELCNGDISGLKLAAYLYERWNEFDKAIAIYKGILSRNEGNLLVKRDLALAYFRTKDFAAAVKTYYSIITAPDKNNYYDDGIKENALAEMNAILAVHQNEFDVSYINHNLIKMVPVDLRITVESNYGYTRKVQFVEPGNATCDIVNPNTLNKGRYSGNDYYYDYTFNEYAIKNAPAGKYRVKVDAYNNYSSNGQVPMFIRVITFKNFQKENMEMEVKLFDLDNQYGAVELDEINW
jgi:TonB-dependent SusC/RagA subfamily outer membrane receptor